jgi:amino acid adenylation domain-containing protein
MFQRHVYNLTLPVGAQSRLRSDPACETYQEVAPEPSTCHGAAVRSNEIEHGQEAASVTHTPPGAPVSLAALVTRAAERWPDRVALIGDSTRLTWLEVERRTQRLAGALITSGVRPGDRVAVARMKGVESLEAVHAVLRAGAVVVPVDPLAPAAAARQVLADAEVSAFLGDARTVRSLDPWTVADRSLDCVIASGVDDERVRPWDDVLADASLDGAELPAVAAGDVAYLIYTSGSTGTPKGIVHTHHSGLAYARLAAAAHSLTADDRLAGMSPLHFDMSTLELYSAPLVGASVVVMGEALLKFPASFTERCENERVTVWYAVPFLLRHISERGAIDRRDLGSLRAVIYAGEPFPPGALRELMEALPDAEFANAYGPAEVNVVTMHEIDELPSGDRDLSIGRPWPGTEIRIVDDDGADLPNGVAGELIVSAPTVMREYWRRPDLSAAKLTPRPGGYAWYATGDIVERTDDGLLWFRGRRDHQVKVRGIRLELEAIESVLTDAPGVAHAVAGPVDVGGEAAHIEAAVVLADGAEFDPDTITRWCLERLPPVAVPQFFDVRAALPANATGKIDRAQVRAELATRKMV